jgi:putative transposase
VPTNEHKSEEIIGKLREVEAVLSQGGTTAEACRWISVSEQTYYRWRKEYGGFLWNRLHHAEARLPK